MSVIEEDARAFKRNVDASSVITLVHRDEADDWYFGDDGPWTIHDLVTVRIKTLVELDSTLVEILDLPLDWIAERSHRGDPWKRSKNVIDSGE